MTINSLLYKAMYYLLVCFIFFVPVVSGEEVPIVPIKKINKSINSNNTSEARIKDKSESEILESLDSLKDQLNNDIFIVETEEDMKQTDHFEDINLNAILNDVLPKNKTVKTQVQEKNSEKALINNLDKSNLMDFEDDQDAWWNDIIEDVDIDDNG